MKLDSVVLRNYRCFTELPVELDPKLTVFVGANGSGKSSLLSAICTLLAPILTRLPIEKKGRTPSIAPADIRLLEPDIAAPFAQLSAKGRFGTVECAWDRTKFRDSSNTTRQSLTTRRETKDLYTVVDGIIDSHNTRKEYALPVFAYYGTNRAVDVPHNRMQPISMPSAFRRLMGLENALESTTDFRRAIGWFDLLERRELRESRDKQQPEAAMVIDAVRRAIVGMIPDVSNPRIDSKTGRFAVDAKDPTGISLRLHLDQLSDGYQVMLGTVMDFALRLALANPPASRAEDVLRTPAIMIVDEVDLHLHPSWQQRVIPDLQRTFPETQFVFTTHSPQVATTVPTASLRILKEGKLHAAPAGTEGAESVRLLERVFLVSTRPDRPQAKKLKEYLRLVDERKWESSQALELRKELDAWSQGEEPMLLEADLRIDNMKWEAAS